MCRPYRCLVVLWSLLCFAGCKQTNDDTMLELANVLVYYMPPKTTGDALLALERDEFGAYDEAVRKFLGPRRVVSTRAQLGRVYYFYGYYPEAVAWLDDPSVWEGGSRIELEGARLCLFSAVLTGQSGSELAPMAALFERGDPMPALVRRLAAGEATVFRRILDEAAMMTWTPRERGRTLPVPLSYHDFLARYTLQRGLTLSATEARMLFDDALKFYLKDESWEAHVRKIPLQADDPSQRQARPYLLSLLASAALYYQAQGDEAQREQWLELLRELGELNVRELPLETWNQIQWAQKQAEPSPSH
ncbi:MAG: hypothetical protein Q7P63_00280 [Verrucomicrobiota bacterium JB022]|nr:hypothetical protein [Verrucomicrobiota bacterium JB022]